jgi:phosphoglycerol transferase MdoB-like AlkP superfamily enzyme
MFKSFFANLPAFLIAAAKLFLLEFFILTICRLAFYFSFKTVDEAQINFWVILKAFRMGLEFDMVATTYAILLPVFLLMVNDFLPKRITTVYKLSFALALTIFCLYALVSAADFPYYKQFGSHLNKQAFLWAASPGFVLRLIFGNISYYGYMFVFMILTVVIYKSVKRIYEQYALRLNGQSVKPLKKGIMAILLIPFLILGARGRTSSKSTTHEGLAIISDNLFVNQIALNPNFTMFRSLLFQKVRSYKVPRDIDESIAYARNYLGIKTPYERSLNRRQKSDSAFKAYNVIIVCMESMSSYKMGIHGRENLTPHFNNIIKESVYFDNFFSSGIHTFNGLFSTCAGYPGMLLDHCLRRYTKKPFVTLGNLLGKKNYQTYLGVTHDPVFDNMQGFFTLNGYENTLSSNDFPHNKVISATGVADHELYDLFIKTINSSDKTKPFLGFLMTGSDHGPWAIPRDIPFNPNANTEEKRSTQYADWAIGKFLENAKKQNWYSNTLFVFLGDHGYSIEGTYDMPLSYHNIPLVLHKPNTLQPDTLNKVGYQPDVLSTVAGILNLDFNNSSFGIDLLKETHPFVFFTADDKIGCVDKEGNFFYELITQRNKRLRKYLTLDQKDYYNDNRATADSLEKGTKMLLDAAEYFIRKDYFSY